MKTARMSRDPGAGGPARRPNGFTANTQGGKSPEVRYMINRPVSHRISSETQNRARQDGFELDLEAKRQGWRRAISLSCPTSFHFAVAVFPVGFAWLPSSCFALRRAKAGVPINRPLFADGLPRRKKVLSASAKATAGQPSARSALYDWSAPLACPAVKKSGRESCRIFEGWWSKRDSNSRPSHCQCDALAN